MVRIQNALLCYSGQRVFQVDVQEYLGGVEGTLKAFQAAIAYVTPLPNSRCAYQFTMDSKYRYLDGDLSQRKQCLEEEIPNIQNI